jgi:RHS repeat-associated protein
MGVTDMRKAKFPSVLRRRLTRRHCARNSQRDLNRRRLVFDPLERRRLLTAVSWTGSGDQHSWADPNNWSTQAVPGQFDDVTINAPANTTISIVHGDAEVINSLTSNAPIADDGELSVATNAQMSANLTVGERVDGGIWNFSNGAVMSVTGAFTATVSTLILNGDLDAASTSVLFTVDNLTLNGTMSLGNSSGSTLGVVDIKTTLGGSGSILFGASTSNLVEHFQQDGPSAVIGANLVIHGKNGSINNSVTIDGPITNQGTINADTAGGTIAILSGQNQGVIKATNGGTINFTLSPDNQAGGLVKADGGTVNETTSQFNNEGSVQAINGGSLAINNLINATGATISVDSSTLTLQGSFIQNQGTIVATNSTVNLAGDFSQADLGTFNRNGGTVNVTGIIRGDLTLDATTGPWIIASGGALVDGKLTQNDGVTAGFAATGSLLVRKTVLGDFLLTLAQNGYLYVMDSLTVIGDLYMGNPSGTASAEILLGTGGVNFSPSSLANTDLGIHTSENTLLTVQGHIIFGGSAENAIINFNQHGISQPGPGDPPADFTYTQQNHTNYYGGSNVEIIGAIQGGKGSIVNEFARSTIKLDSSVTVDGSTSAMSIGGGGPVTAIQNTLFNNVAMQAINGASLSIGNLSQTAGTVAATGASLTFTGTLANSNTISATNSSVSFNGTFTQAQLGTFNRTGSSVFLSGTLVGGLTLDASTGSWFLSGGTIAGGTVSESGGSELAFTQSGGLLNQVVVNGDMDLDAGLSPAIQGSAEFVNVHGGLTLNGTMYLGNAATSVFGTVTFGDSVNVPDSLLGSGTVVFSGSSTSGNQFVNGWQGTGSQALTVGPGITIRGKSGTIKQTVAANPIILNGTVSADVAGGTIQLGAGGAIVNQGLVQAINGATISGIALVNNPGKTISSVGSTLSLSGAWANAGTIVATNATLNLAGTFTRATLGNFVRTGGTVNLTGRLQGGLNLDAANGSWRLAGGTVDGGAVNTSGGSKLILTSLDGTLNAVTVNGDIDATEPAATATFTGGLVLNGTLTMGNAAGNSASLNFGTFNTSPGSLTGAGAIVFASNAVGGNTIHNSSSLGGASGTFTIGRHITIHGKTGGLLNDSASGTIVNQGQIVADTAAATITVGGFSGTFINQGPLQANGGALKFQGAVSLDGQATVTTDWTANITVTGNLADTTTAIAAADAKGVVSLSGSSSSANPKLLEVTSKDLGATAAGFKRNSAYGTIVVNTDTVKLVDQSDNAPGGPDALYVNQIRVSSFETLDLNGLHVYARAVQVDGGSSIVNGTIMQLPDGGPIDVNSPVPGAIAPAGNQDSWTFFGRAGEAVTAFVNNGTANPPAPIGAALPFAAIQLVAPDNSVLASGASSTSGAPVSLASISLPADGVYTIKISAAAGHTSGTGAYVVDVWDVSPQTQPLLLGQNSSGSIDTPFDIDKWTFSALAGEQVKLYINNATSSGLLYSLTGPNGFVGFTNLTGDSALVNLTSTGAYTLSVQGANGATGHYSFVLNPTALTNIPLNGSINGTLVGSDQAQLFTIAVPAAQTLSVALDDQSVVDSNELYLRFGLPPTRETFDYRYSGASAPDQSIVVPHAAVGTWYVLIYGANVPVQSSFSLSAVGAGLQVAHVTPPSLGDAAPAPLVITGAGFLPGTTATLIGPGNTEIGATSSSVVSFTQLDATFPAGLPAGVYSIKVTQGALTQTLSNVFTETPGGSAHLQLDLKMPDSLGRHAAATVYVSYANVGTVAMPAPLLVLESTDPVQKPLLTLDSTKVAEGLFTSTLPSGFSNTIQILGSGQVPGMLLPGESFAVPVYYAGLQLPYDLSHTSVPLGLGAIDTTDTTLIDWSQFKSDLKPPETPDAAWDQAYANLTAQLGSTQGQFVTALDANAAYLGGLGRNATDVGELWAFMALQAGNDLGSPAPLASALDAVLPTPGAEDMLFARDYFQSLAARDTIGILGYGWTASFQSKLSPQPDGSVILTRGVGGVAEVFEPDTRGGYFSPDQTVSLSGNVDGSLKLTRADGTFENFTPDGHLASQQDTNGNRISFSYGGGGRLIGVVSTSGSSFTLAYNAVGRLASVTDSDGRVTTYSYDASNQYLLSVTTPQGTTAYAYDLTNHALTSIAYPDNTHEFFSYDGQARLSGASLDGGVAAQGVTYTAPGEVTVTDAVGNVTRLDYDSFGLLARSVDPRGNPTYVTYDTQANVTSVTDAVGATTAMIYDAAGNLVRLTDRLGGTTQFTYGANSRLTSMVDPASNTTRYAYDTRGNQLTATYVDGTQESRAFDPLGNPLTFINRNGQPLSATYNSFGQVTHETFADASHFDYTYDAHNNLSTATDVNGAITFTYESADRMTSVSYPGGKSLTFTYDAGGRRTRMVDQSGYTVNYVYTAAGELQKLTDAGNVSIVTYVYDVAGRLAEQDNANGTFTTYEYDTAGNVVHLVNHAPGGDVNSRFDATYDLLNQRTSVATLDGTWTYSYDDSGQLTRAIFTSTNPAVANQDLAYNYDPAGNRTSTVIDGVTTIYVANAMNEYTSIGGVAQHYDADGNLLFDGTNTYTYNQLDQLVSAASAGGTTQYTYNALGQRTTQVTGAATTKYVTDPVGLGDVVAMYDGAGQLQAHFNYGQTLVSRIDAVGSSAFFDFDLTGSTVGMSNSGGGYANSYRYLPFGEMLTANAAIPNPFQFAGALGVQADADGLSFMRARYHAPAAGRFTSSDRLRLAGGDVNFYRYASNQPLQFVDPGGFGCDQYHPATGMCTHQFSLEPLQCHITTPSQEKTDQMIRQWEHDDYLINHPQSSEPSEPDFLRWQQIQQLSNWITNTDREIERLSQEEKAVRDFDDPYIEGMHKRAVYALRINLEHKKSYTRSLLNLLLKDTFLQFSDVASAIDPNDKTGPGFGSQGFVAAGTTQPYRVDFENDPSATAPAQQVVITDKLSNNDDWSSFRITEVGWGNMVIAVPANSQHFQTTVPMTFNGQLFHVLVQVGINLSTGLLTARFFSIDPVTQLPPDVLTGFLPPEDGTGRGMGYFSYTVSPKPGLPTGTQIRNVADVSFDEQPIIATNQVSETDPTQGTDPNKEALVTIDAGSPTSSVAPLPGTENLPSFTVNWSGQDDPGGSGISSYSIYVSDNGAAFQPWLTGTAITSATYYGQYGHAYGFYSVATDNVSNVQPSPNATQAMTQVVSLVTWTGGGAGNLWSDPANWGGTAPGANSALAFSGNMGLMNTDDISAGTQFDGVVFNAGAGAFVLSGNAVDLDGNIVNSSTRTQTVNLPLTLVSGTTLNAASGNLTLAGGIAQSGGSYGITKSGPGAVTLSGPGSFTGGVTVLAGTLTITDLAALPDGSSLVVGSASAFAPVVPMAAPAPSVAANANREGRAPIALASVSGNAAQSSAIAATGSLTASIPAAAIVPSGSSINRRLRDDKLVLPPSAVINTSATSGMSASAVQDEAIQAVTRRKNVPYLPWLPESPSMLDSAGPDDQRTARIQALDAVMTEYRGT